MRLIYNVKDKPKFGQLIIFAFQQLLAIMTATLVVPVIINDNTIDAITSGTIKWQMTSSMSSAAALFGAGIGTLVYIFFTKAKSPVFLGSSFAFIGSMSSAFAGAISMCAGFAGLIIGAIMAGLVYVMIVILVRFAGISWLNKLMPTVVIGPTVALIGFSLATNAIKDLQTGGIKEHIFNWGVDKNGIIFQKEVLSPVADPRICILVGIFTFLTVVFCVTYGKKMSCLIPFIIGILVGYSFAALLTVIGINKNINAFKILDFEAYNALLINGRIALSKLISPPEFTFVEAFKGLKDIDSAFIAHLVVAYVPVAFVVFAEHIADHKNISYIIGTDLLEEPGLHRTLLGDGVGSICGALFGGCPNTTYGESIACVAITGNASVITIIVAAIGAIIISFLTPFVAFVSSIPPCVISGVCISLYGFIAVSGLKMIQKVDLEKNKNLFVVCTILITGLGKLSLTFGKIQVTTIACALILGIIVNIFVSKASD